MSNQVYVVEGVSRKQTDELNSLVDKDNAEGCGDYFWSAPITNSDETVGLSERTSWRVRGRYVAEPINKPLSFDKPSSSGTKDIPEVSKKSSSVSSKTTEVQKKEPKQKLNIHKSQEQLAEQKRQRNKRYMKNLNERKQFWQYQNPKFIPVKKETKVKPYDQTGSNSQMNRKGSFGTNSFYSKNRKPSFGPNTKDHNRKPSFGPNTKVQNQKPSFGPSTITQNQKLSFDPNNRAQNRMSGLGHKSHSPQS